MDLLAYQLHSIVKDAPLDECKNILKEMPFQQAVGVLKKRYSKQIIRNKYITLLKETFTDLDDETIKKVLEEKNDDFNDTFEYFLNNPPSLEENIKKGIVPKEEIKKIKIRSPKSSKKTLIIPRNEQKSLIKNPPPNNINVTPQRNTAHVLPKMETPFNKIQSSINQSSNSPSASINYHLPNTQKPKGTNKNPILIDDEYSSISSPSNSYEYSQYYSSDPYEEEEEEYLKTKEIDLHNLTKKEARLVVEDEIIHAPANRIGVIHFITGVGNHSANFVPVLKPMVLDICKKLNVYARVPEMNSGVVVCNFTKKPNY